MDLLQAAMIARLFLRCRAAVCALFSVLGGKESLDRVCPGSVRCPDDSCPRGVRALAGSCPGYVRMPGWIPVQGVSDTWLAAVRGASGPGNSLSCMPAWRERKETGSGDCLASGQPLDAGSCQDDLQIHGGMSQKRWQRMLGSSLSRECPMYGW